MFKRTIDCPKETKNESICAGYRNPETGALKNDCAICEAYKRYVKEKYPD